MRRPSGDQLGEPCQLPGPWLSCIGLDPSASASQISLTSPERPEANTIRRPSGEKLGLLSGEEEKITAAFGRPASKE